MKKTEINYPTQEWLDNWVDKYIDKNPNEKITDFKALEEKANRRQQYGLVSADLAHSSVSHGMNAAGSVADISNKDYTGATVNAVKASETAAPDVQVPGSVMPPPVPTCSTAACKRLADRTVTVIRETRRA